MPFGNEDDVELMMQVAAGWLQLLLASVNSNPCRPLPQWKGNRIARNPSPLFMALPNSHYLEGQEQVIGRQSSGELE